MVNKRTVEDRASAPVFINVCLIFCEEAEAKYLRSAHMQRALTRPAAMFSSANGRTEALQMVAGLEWILNAAVEQHADVRLTPNPKGVVAASRPIAERMAQTLNEIWQASQSSMLPQLNVVHVTIDLTDGSKLGIELGPEVGDGERMRVESLDPNGRAAAEGIQ